MARSTSMVAVRGSSAGIAHERLEHVRLEGGDGEAHGVAVEEEIGARRNHSAVADRPAPVLHAGPGRAREDDHRAPTIYVEVERIPQTPKQLQCPRIAAVASGAHAGHASTF